MWKDFWDAWCYCSILALMVTHMHFNLLRSQEISLIWVNITRYWMMLKYWVEGTILREMHVCPLSSNNWRHGEMMSKELWHLVIQLCWTFRKILPLSLNVQKYDLCNLNKRLIWLQQLLVIIHYSCAKMIGETHHGNFSSCMHILDK